jgi:hypothetical protein
MSEFVETKTIIASLEQLAQDIQSDDGVANAVLLQAAERMRELQEKNAKIVSVHE